MIEIKVKRFEELTLNELYSLLQLRMEVFCVEQNCVYQDIDGKDKKALHVLGFKEGNLIAYTRLFAPGEYFDIANIGRVVVAKNERKHKYREQRFHSRLLFGRDYKSMGEDLYAN